MMNQQPHRASTDDANFAANMRFMREQRGWSQGDFARRLTQEGLDGFHQTTVSRIEKMERPVRLGEARGIARVLGTTLEEMVEAARDVKIANDLEECYRDVRRQGWRIGAAVEDYLESQGKLARALDRARAVQVEQGLPNGTLGETIMRHMSNSQALLKKTYIDAINEWFSEGGEQSGEDEGGASQ